MVAFVVLLATMPPLQITKAPSATLGYRVRLDTARWESTIEKYWDTVKHGDLGKDRSGVPVSDLVASRLGNSLKLMAISLVIAVVLGVLKGLWDFNQQRRGKPGIGSALTGVMQGLPDFWLVLVVQLAAVWLYNHTGLRPFPPAWDDAQVSGSMVLPVFCLALVPLAYIARITNQSMTSVYDQDYIRTARAKGLSEMLVVYKHALKSAVVPILDGLPNALAVLFSTMLIVEVLFRFPGVTILLKDSIRPGFGFGDIRTPMPPVDVPVLVAASVALGIIFTFLYSGIVVLRRVVDPRLRERE